MQNGIQIYWTFLNRPAPLSSNTTGFEALPNLWRDVLIFSLFFSAIFMIVKSFTSRVLIHKFQKINERKRSELPSYVLCLIHHMVAVPFAWQNIYHDFNLSSDEVKSIDYAPITSIIAPWCIAYLIVDTIFYAIPEAINWKFEYILHHSLTLFLVVSSLLAPGSILRFIPHLLISDTTNIFFNFAWLLRLFGGGGTYLLVFLELSFAASFLLIRAINMPCMFWALGSQAEGLGYARFALVPIALMQWYWLCKIIRGVSGRFTVGAVSSESKIRDPERQKKQL